MPASNTNGLDLQQQPPGTPNTPYVISSQDGEIIYIPLSKSATRLLVTGKETENAFAIVSSGGSQSDPIGFHYHRETHDVFLCLAGQINVWAGNQCRTLSAGDFASVPPGTIHQYQILGAHSEMAGLIVPGGWEEFFRFIGEPYGGPTWPLHDERRFHEVLLPRLKQAAEKFDMVPCPQTQSFEPQAWDLNTDSKLPGKLAPYFVQNAMGPGYEFGGMVCRPLITTAESDGKFAIGSLESSVQFQEQGIFGDGGARAMCFELVHHAFMVVHGTVLVKLEERTPTKMTAGEVVYVPKGTAFRLQTTSRFSNIYVFASGAGLVEVLCKLGTPFNLPVLPETASKVDVGGLEALQSKYGFVLR
ncbi:hypothetical protein LTR62_004301 [Meristemomyces frigidus]|uniref:Cupin type-2 domain-containing protein n=1 Tax=Meristemomyces frigidus TaxID=1508187 RepID=A0AAN7YP89_9PEZI|nr:hypothetical protein LTR62_004301 [Meristemomyces frigidus]